jgi:pimeloyl-ACP methyl ester carboxylesterase
MSAHSRHYELVRAVTPDGVQLHGLYQSGRGTVETRPDAAVVLHGLGGNFYSSTLLLRLADALVEQGINVVAGNTRGHDGISSSQSGGRSRTIGAAFEIVDECRQDVAGWVEWLMAKRNFRRVLLVGHSLGAIKSLYAAAHAAHPAIAGVAGLSATRLCHEQFLRSPGRDEFQKWFGRAASLVAAGEGDQLLPVRFPFPTWIAASAYRDKYGPEDRYDWTPLAGQISVPVLLLYGSRELAETAAFHGLWKSATAATSGLPNYTLQIVESADHFYAGVTHRAATALSQWIATTWPGG